MKKNRTMRVAVLMLALTLITCCFVGSTFAKYTSTYNGQDTVVVAKWDVASNVDGAETFTLFNTVKDSDAENNETDVATGMIAPGTTGEFTYEVSNSSDVTAEYTITFTITWACGLTATDLVFTVEDGYTLVADNSVPGKTTYTIKATGSENVTDVISMGEAANEITITWTWAFDADDTTVDNAIGEAAKDAENNAARTVTVDTQIVVNQVD